MRDQAKLALWKWDPEERAWYIEYGKIEGADLKKPEIF